MTTHCGSCLCGAVQVAASGAPIHVAACHCESCRRQTGAPFAVFADFSIDQVSFSRSLPALYESSPGRFRGFCAVCGSTISYQGTNLPEMIHLHIGILNSADDFEPQGDENVSNKLSWVRIPTAPAVPPGR